MQMIEFKITDPERVPEGTDSEEVRQYMVELRQRLQTRLRQKVIYITAQSIRIP